MAILQLFVDCAAWRELYHYCSIKIKMIGAEWRIQNSCWRSGALLFARCWRTFVVLVVKAVNGFGESGDIFLWLVYGSGFQRSRWWPTKPVCGKYFTRVESPLLSQALTVIYRGSVLISLLFFCYFPEFMLGWLNNIFWTGGGDEGVWVEEV